MASLLIKNRTDQRHLKRAAQVAALVCDTLIAELKPGMNASEMELRANRLLAQHQCSAPFKRFDNYGYALCVSLNEEVVNGQPLDSRVIKEGDVVSIAVGAEYRGLHGKVARTVYMGDEPPEDIARLLKGTASVFEVVETWTPDTANELIAKTRDLVAQHGITMLKDTGGCGIGKELHQYPPLPNLPEELENPIPLETGMALTLMPMATLSESNEWELAEDGWTYLIKDGSPAAHFAETLLVEDGRFIILSRAED